jgi:putative restriction endonuclease
LLPQADAQALAPQCNKFAQQGSLLYFKPIHHGWTMKLYVAITDFSWFTYLSIQKPDEVNFWQPSGGRTFRALEPGEPLLFKLHSPRNFIVGGGFFSRFTLCPLSYAWDAFQYKNGAQTFAEMRERVQQYRRSEVPIGPDETIGCILLQQPFFFKPEQWIPASDWSSSIVQGKTYDTATFEGQTLWADVQARLGKDALVLDESVSIATQKYGKPQVILPRLGQGAFRVIVADAYKRQCALSSSRVLHVLESAHIKPYVASGTHSPTNGILLREDIHTLFDLGYITVTQEYKAEISKRMKEEFENGAEYYSMHGKSIHLPEIEQFRPSQEMLTWHNEKIFRP